MKLEKLEVYNLSMLETKTWLRKSRDRNLISEKEFESLDESLETLHKKLNNYIRSIGPQKRPMTNDKIKILIVEDEGVTALGLRKSLEALGYSVPAIADNGEEAIQKAGENLPDLVVMDIMLKGEMDGIEAAGKITSQWSVPVVFLTAYDDGKMLDRAKAAGPFGYLIKPFEERTLHSTIEMALYKHKMVKELQRAKEEAEEATKLKDKFISLVAHDLKSPFTAILGFMKFIMEDADPPLHHKHKELFEHVITQGNRMVDLIQELLDISRLKTGKITPKFRFVDGYFLGANVALNLKSTADKKGVGLACEIPRGTRLYADVDLFAQALSNLVSNAIKFCKEGNAVTLFVPSDEKSTIAVKDTGMGIPKERQATLFRYEEHTSTPGTAGERGTGLGLPLSLDIMKAHGGTLELESSPGQGSTFYARLPLVRPRVLVVDDDADTRLMVKRQLADLDLEILEAGNGEDALGLLAKECPHLIITDINMPVMDGLELLENIRNRLSLKDLPIIVLTADNEEKNRDEVFNRGGNDFANKPLSKTDFIARVKRFVG